MAMHIENRRISLRCRCPFVNGCCIFDGKSILTTIVVRKVTVILEKNYSKIVLLSELSIGLFNPALL